MFNSRHLSKNRNKQTIRVLLIDPAADGLLRYTAFNLWQNELLKKRLPLKKLVGKLKRLRELLQRSKRSNRAIKIYESGVTAVQKRKFSAAAKALREIIDDYPEERELQERAKLYLTVCDRELNPVVAEPTTLDERVYAATVALNSGASSTAIDHLNAVAYEKPADAQVQYMLSVAHAVSGDADLAITHLERAIRLNPDNRLLARQEPDFENIHDNDRFCDLTAPEEDMDVSD